jgi:hypothetical protein
MKRITCGLVLSALAGMALGQEVATGDEKPAADQAEDATEASTAAVAKTGEKAVFSPPPGFKTKKRGKLVLYCIKDSTVGTRFKTEKCYDEAQVRDYIIAQQENKRDIDKVRATCSSGSEWCVRR